MGYGQIGSGDHLVSIRMVQRAKINMGMGAERKNPPSEEGGSTSSLFVRNDSAIIL
jgi:hypothetical protein